MSQFIDRRPNSKNKSAVNRQRFIRRFKNQIKQAVSDAVIKRSITDIERGEKITIPAKDTYEPKIHYGNGGFWEMVHAGNKQFTAGDRIRRSSSADGQGSEASNTGEGWDEFGFELSREEFLDLFFDNLELPNLVRKQLLTLQTKKFTRAGYTTQGTPANLSIIRSLKTAHTRRLAIGAFYRKELREAEQKLEELLLSKFPEHPDVVQQQLIITRLRAKILRIPFVDPYDLRYHNKIISPQASTSAVMFCIMDVSGSMDELKKDAAKRFFILLYIFLTRHYEKIDIIFVRHHTTAKEVNEQDFFYSRETGGTVVSSALELTRDIIQARYSPNDWNIYIAQASDGDNWSADSPYCQEILRKSILPLVQYYAYVEIMPRYHQSLWEAYESVKKTSDHFAMQTINETADIYPVFRELFKAKSLV